MFKIVAFIVVLVIASLIPIFNVDEVKKSDIDFLSQQECINKLDVSNISNAIRGEKKLNVWQFVFSDKRPIKFAGCKDEMIHIYIPFGGSSTYYGLAKKTDGYVVVKKEKKMH